MVAGRSVLTVGTARSLAKSLADAEARLRAAGIDRARLEAEVLLGHALATTREQLYARLREAITAEEHIAYERLLLRRLKHEPAAYITGHREFHGLDFECTPAALIPRPETELLVECALDWLRDIPDVPYPTKESGRRNRESGPLPSSVVTDVGTGGGAIAVAIAVHTPNARVIGIDSSVAALALAKRNAEAHGVADRIEFVEGDLLGSPQDPVDLIVANLPYVSTRLYEKLPPEIREHEPEAALHAGRRGTALIERLLRQAPTLLRSGGLLLAEHAWNQGATLREAARRAFPNAHIDTKRDLAGHERLLVVES